MDALWLDEIWSLALVEQAAGPLDILVKIRHDNNHWLNSLWLYALGGRHDWTLYRWPAVVTGGLSVLLVGLLGARRSKDTALIAAFLAAESYLLVLYGSESRGYAPAVFFCLLCRLIARDEGGGGLGRAALYWLSAVLALLSHLSALFILSALAASSLWQASASKNWSRLLLWHLPPLLASVGLWVVSVRGMVIGGGPQYPPMEVAAQFVSLLLGGPFTGTGMWVVAGAGTLALFWGVWKLAVAAPAEAVFAAAITIVPAAAVALLTPEVLYARYFLTLAPFYLLLLADGAVRLWRSNSLGKVLSVLAVAAVAAGNGYDVYRQIAIGRGQYPQAMRFMAAHSPNKTITVGSDNDMRTAMALRFYAPRIPVGVTFEYVPLSRFTEDSPRWLIVHSQAHRLEYPARLAVNGRGYTFERCFSRFGLSGFHWILYQGKAPPPGGSGGGGRSGDAAARP